MAEFEELRKHIRKLERENGPQSLITTQEQIQHVSSMLPPDSVPPVFILAYIARAILVHPHKWDMIPFLLQTLEQIEARCQDYQRQAGSLLEWDEHCSRSRGPKDPSGHAQGRLTENKKAAVRRMKKGLFAGTQTMREVYLCFSYEIRIHHIRELVLDQKISIPSLEDYFPLAQPNQHLYTFSMSPKEMDDMRREREALVTALDQVESYQQKQESSWQRENPNQSIDLLYQDEEYRNTIRGMFPGTVEWEKLVKNILYWLKRAEKMVEGLEGAFTNAKRERTDESPQIEYEKRSRINPPPQYCEI